MAYRVASDYISNKYSVLSFSDLKALRFYPHLK